MLQEGKETGLSTPTSPPAAAAAATAGACAHALLLQCYPAGLCASVEGKGQGTEDRERGWWKEEER